MAAAVLEARPGRLYHSSPQQWFTVWGTEVVPRLSIAGGVIGVILVNSTLPQVVRTSHGKIPSLTSSMKFRMIVRITPMAGGLKAVQYGSMREMKLALDHMGCHPGLSTMVSFGVLGTLFQSVIYNTLIAEMYRVYLDRVTAKPSFTELAKGVAPGVVWCFARECFSMGGGLYLGPIVRQHIGEYLTKLQEERRKAGSGAEQSSTLDKLISPNGPVLRFSSGLLSGACTAFATQWIHNTTLVAGRMAAAGQAEGAPFYTSVSLRAAWSELGPRLFFLNYPQRLTLIAGAVGLLNMVDIFHRPELRML